MAGVNYKKTSLTSKRGGGGDDGDDNARHHHADRETGDGVNTRFGVDMNATEAYPRSYRGRDSLLRLSLSPMRFVYVQQLVMEVQDYFWLGILGPGVWSGKEARKVVEAAVDGERKSAAAKGEQGREEGEGGGEGEGGAGTAEEQQQKAKAAKAKAKAKENCEDGGEGKGKAEGDRDGKGERKGEGVGNDGEGARRRRGQRGEQ